jgi:peptidoglycan/xylan/chitin deacetylase (PgdA/CDA1 family)
MAIAELLAEAGQVLGRDYPEFVYDDRPLAGDYLPVFAFHSLGPADFAAQLAFLSANRYRTISLDDAVAWIEGRAPLPPRAVVLTIDDGRLSTWSIGYPLLERFGMTATAFVIPGYLEDGPPRPLPDDPFAAAVDERYDGRTALRWSEVAALHASGVIAIESHSMLHRKVVVSDELDGFLGPDWSEPPFELPLAPDEREAWTAARRTEHAGMPLFRAVSVLLTDAARPVRPEAIAACEHLVRSAGPGFFRDRGAERRLARALRAAGPPLGAPVDVEACRRWELGTAKATLEARLPGKQVRHFCYPRGRGAPRAERLVAAAGYASACWSFLPQATSNRRGRSALRLGRLKHDFLWRLPGDGNRPLRDVLAGKLTRRLRGGTGY